MKISTSVFRCAWHSSRTHTQFPGAAGLASRSYGRESEIDQETDLSGAPVILRRLSLYPAGLVLESIDGCPHSWVIVFGRNDDQVVKASRPSVQQGLCILYFRTNSPGRAHDDLVDSKNTVAMLHKPFLVVQSYSCMLLVGLTSLAPERRSAGPSGVRHCQR